ncbi:hypothetical protein AYI68_g77 [Smittium mucronatum]|uniref:Uncharacterized protein n=1 Tax=Smittium mucronatum TaxID=133383 RepID=A0A1R0H9C1_9FUNG|nr:hypothetical protein AYI68_g77 [Smittium mucronatum]
MYFSDSAWIIFMEEKYYSGIWNPKKAAIHINSKVWQSVLIFYIKNNDAGIRKEILGFQITRALSDSREDIQILSEEKFEASSHLSPISTKPHGCSD